MELRWIVTCDENGRKTDPELQFWNDENKEWEGIPWIVCKKWEIDKFNKEK